MIFSIVIPVYNDHVELENVLYALHSQNYDSARYEIIIVDNGSEKSIDYLLNKYSNIKYLEEKKFLGSPYSCRNRGIEIAKGDIIALLDATCIPDSNWLRSAETCFSVNSADMVAGAVTFRFEKKKPTTAELLDSLINIRMKFTVETKNAAKTANLFVKKDLFDRYGLFEEGLRSGGDVTWSKMITNSGYKLVYCEKAEVYKIARKLKELIRKQIRVGYGHARIWKKSNQKISVAKLVATIFIPPSLSEYKRRLDDYTGGDSYLIRIFFLAYALKIIVRCANILGVMAIKVKTK